MNEIHLACITDCWHILLLTFYSPGLHSLCKQGKVRSEWTRNRPTWIYQVIRMPLRFNQKPQRFTQTEETVSVPLFASSPPSTGVWVGYNRGYLLHYPLRFDPLAGRHLPHPDRKERFGARYFYLCPGKEGRTGHHTYFCGMLGIFTDSHAYRQTHSFPTSFLIHLTTDFHLLIDPVKAIFIGIKWNESDTEVSWMGPSQQPAHTCLCRVDRSAPAAQTNFWPISPLYNSWYLSHDWANHIRWSRNAL